MTEELEQIYDQILLVGGYQGEYLSLVYLANGEANDTVKKYIYKKFNITESQAEEDIMEYSTCQPEEILEFSEEEVETTLLFAKQANDIERLQQIVDVCYINTFQHKHILEKYCSTQILNKKLDKYEKLIDSLQLQLKLQEQKIQTLEKKVEQLETTTTSSSIPQYSQVEEKKICSQSSTSSTSLPDIQFSSLSLDIGKMIKPSQIIQENISSFSQLANFKNGVEIIDLTKNHTFLELFSAMRECKHFYILFFLNTGEIFGSYHSQSPQKLGEGICDPNHFIFTIGNDYDEPVRRIEWLNKPGEEVLKVTQNSLQISKFVQVNDLRNGIIYSERFPLRQFYKNPPSYGRKVFSSVLEPKKFRNLGWSEQI